MQYTRPGKTHPYWAATIGQITATGATKAEATHKLHVLLERCVTGNFLPTLIFFDGHMAVVFRQQEFWWYHIRQVGMNGPTIGHIHGVYDTEEEANRRARITLAWLAHMPPADAVQVILDAYDRGVQLEQLQTKTLDDNIQAAFDDLKFVGTGETL